MSKSDWSEDEDEDYDVFDRVPVVTAGGVMTSSSNNNNNIDTQLPTSCVLHTLIERNEIERIKAIIKHRQEQQQQQQQDQDQQQFVSRPSININERDRWGATPIHISIFERNLECFKLLLPVSDLQVKCQGSPLGHVICAIGALPDNYDFAVQALELLFKAIAKDGATILTVATDDYNRTALRLACELSLNVEMIRILLNAIDITLATTNNNQPTGQPTTRKQLLAVQDSIIKFSALHAAVSSPATTIESVTEILSRTAGNGNDLVELLKLGDYMGRTPLHIAFQTKLNIQNRSFYDVLKVTPGLNLDKLRDVMGNLPSSNNNNNNHSSHHVRRGPTQIFTHPDCLKHHTCPPSASYKPYLASRSDEEIPPENVNRLRVLLDQGYGTLLSNRLSKAKVAMKLAPLCELGDVLRVHDYAYVQNFRSKCEKLDGDELDVLDGDTTFSEHTFSAALRAAGSACAGLDEIMSGKAENIFCAVRPPGHHAGPFGIVGGCSSHGFCFFNNVAIAAGYALTRYRDKIKRVAIVDFDVHHGNGTEVCVEALTPTNIAQKFESHFGCDVKLSMPFWKPWLGEQDPNNVLFCSVHGFGKPVPGKSLDPMIPPFGSFYPGSGATRNDKNIVDVGQNSRSRFDWRTSWRNIVLPRVEEFKPDLIIISAGFDAHKADFINGGYCGALEFDYVWLTKALVGIANKTCEGRILSVLEGGYRIQGKNVSAFARSVHDHVVTLAEANSDWIWDRNEAEVEERIDKEMKMKAIAEAEELERRKQAERATLLMNSGVNVNGFLMEEDDESDDNEEEGMLGSKSTTSSSSSSEGDEQDQDQNQVVEMDIVMKEKIPTATTTTTSSNNGNNNNEATRPKRRAAATIDFVKLNEELEKEKAAKKIKLQQEQQKQ
jgi:acetoin utilization deacetylase AcuC-like enzyme